MNAKSTLLSVGMIFKNEVRCLERCLKSLLPLREKIPMEIVMADTGATDGSREIAEKYADILFDFPWRNDFSAARNAVLERCSGKWYLAIDADEWLQDGNELVRFVKDNSHSYETAVVTQRNFQDMSKPDLYSDTFPMRMLLLSTGRRYSGVVHEDFGWSGMRSIGLRKTILLHDGYCRNIIREKRNRNLPLLRETLSKDPDNIRTLVQCIESSNDEDDAFYYAQRALEVLQRNPSSIKNDFVPSLYRHAIRLAGKKGMVDEAMQWLADGLKAWPNSIVLRIDGEAAVTFSCHTAERWSESVEHALRCRKAIDEWDNNINGIREAKELIFASPSADTPDTRLIIPFLIFLGHMNMEQWENAEADFPLLALDKFDESNLSSAAHCVLRAAPYWKHPGRALLACWNTENGPTILPSIFAEQTDRSALAAITELGDCDAARSARIMLTDNLADITMELAALEKWTGLFPNALYHALELGLVFPPLERPLNLEEMDVLAASMRIDQTLKLVFEIRDISPDADMQSLLWRRALVLAAMRNYDWSEGEDRYAFARIFTEAERAFLPRCYTEETLRDLYALPPLHRFGWHCIRVIDALDAGDLVGAAQTLRNALENCPEQKSMVEFLLSEVRKREKRRVMERAPAELKELAEKIRAILARYPPDDPAVAQLKSSPAYQRVADLIEYIE